MLIKKIEPVQDLFNIYIYYLRGINMTMKELYEKVLQAQESKEAKYQESKSKESEVLRSKFKDDQKEFVKFITELAEKRVTEVSEDADYRKKFVDVFTFSLPPRRNENQNVKFKDHLLIELMEGSESSGYSDYFKSLDTVPTLDLLREAFAPLQIHYGYYRRFGNIIQVRWDDNVPGWALSDPKQFEEKKAVSRRNKLNKSGNGPRSNANRSNVNRSNGNRSNGNRKWQPQNNVANMKNPFQLMHEFYGQGNRRPYNNNNNRQRNTFRGGRRQYNANTSRNYGRGQQNMERKPQPQKENVEPQTETQVEPQTTLTDMESQTTYEDTEQ